MRETAAFQAYMHQVTGLFESLGVLHED